jgi:hypothetical protein
MLVQRVTHPCPATVIFCHSVTCCSIGPREGLFPLFCQQGQFGICTKFSLTVCEFIKPPTIRNLTTLDFLTSKMPSVLFQAEVYQGTANVNKANLSLVLG